MLQLLPVRQFPHGVLTLAEILDKVIIENILHTHSRISVHRSNGSILHNLITVGQRPGSGYTLNNVTSAVLYKIIHYFMENPINEKTVLKYPVADIDVSDTSFRLRNNKFTYLFPPQPPMQTVYTNCGIAIKDYYGDRGVNELNFSVGALITNIQNKTGEWAVGDHRGDKQKYFRPDHVRLLRKDELTYVKDLVSDIFTVS